jgi:hypothetical protein
MKGRKGQKQGLSTEIELRKNSSYFIMDYVKTLKLVTGHDGRGLYS